MPEPLRNAGLAKIWRRRGKSIRWIANKLGLKPRQVYWMFRPSTHSSKPIGHDKEPERNMERPGIDLLINTANRTSYAVSKSNRGADPSSSSR